MVMVAEVVNVLVVERSHVMVVAVAAGARVRVVVWENTVHPCLCVEGLSRGEGLSTECGV
jgi:hypothetical protein